MPMRSKKSLSKKAIRHKLDKRAGFIMLVLLGVFVIGGTQAFSAIGSDWAIDVKLESVGYETSMYSVSSLPATADVYQSGNRLVTIDYDKSIRTGLTIPTSSLNLGVFGTYTVPTVTPSTTGLYPTVSHGVGNLFFCDENGNPTETGARYFEETGEDIGNLHYYYGFSVMFTTRGEVYYINALGAGALIGNRQSGENGWLAYTQVAPYKELDARSVVALDLHSLSSSFVYDGVLNSVEVVNTRARYTLAEAISGVGNDITTFNSEYNWLSHNMKGWAVESKAPVITYSQIDSESNNYATIELGAKLAIGIDSPQQLPQYLVSQYSGLSVALLNGALNPLGYDLAGPINVYNVEYIFDLVVDVSLNGMPLSDYLGGYAAGTLDGLLAASEVEEPISIWIYIIIGIIVVIVLRLMF